MKLKNLLNEGLSEGFAGKTQYGAAKRGPFDVKTSKYTSRDGGTYHDEWIANRTGGGQEIVEINGKKATRLYGGGTIFTELLEKLNVSDPVVIDKLKKFILESEGKTRLHMPFKPEPDGDWQYEYKILTHRDEIPVTCGEETITYKGVVVFSHLIINTTVE